MPQAVTLQGTHVRLEPLGRHHIEPLLHAAEGFGTRTVWTPIPRTLEDMRGYVEDALAGQAHGTALPFATVRASDGTVMGTTRFAALEYWQWPRGNPHAQPTGIPDAVEIGWTWLTPAAQRTALNTEAKILMLDHAFTVWKVHRVTLKTDVRNAQSRANIERVGARMDGVLRVQMPAADGGFRDSAWYSLLPAEWPPARERLWAALTSARTG